MACAPPPLLRAACALVVPVALASCAAKSGLTYLAPTGETVTAYTEAAYGAEGQHIVVEDRSTVEVVVTSLRLRDCENIRNECQLVRMRELVRPGERHRLATVHPADPNKASGFGFSWSWEPVGDSPEIPR